MATPISAQRFVSAAPFDLEYGGRLASLEIAYETWGRPSRQRDNAVLLCPAFSGHSHANSHEGDPSPGWWEGMVGPGLAFDTDDYYVICPSLLGGSYGTSGPLSIDAESGEPWRSRFPVVGVRDLVDAHVRLLDHLGVSRVLCAAGGSLGAMQALELAVRYPERVQKVLAASGTDRTRPHTAAIRHLGRQAILLDPDFHGGDYSGHGPTQGLALAREIGTVFYRSRDEFNQRFRWQPIAEPSRGGAVFDVQSYLRHQGQKILGDFDANSYLTLSLAMDLFDVWRGFPSRETALEPVEAEFMIIGINEDRLIPIDEQEWLHHALVTAGKRSHWRRIENHIGHDWFLVEIDQITGLVRELLR